MDSDSSSKSGGGDRRRRNRDGNRNRSRRSSGSGDSRNRSGNNKRRSQRSSGSDSGGDTYRPSGAGSPATPPKKKPGLLGKIVGFFKGDEPANKGTGRPIQTKRTRPGMSDEPAAGESKPNSERSSERRNGGGRDSSRSSDGGGDRPKRKRTRSRNRRRSENGEGGAQSQRRSSGDGENRRTSSSRDGGGRSREGDRDRNRRGGRGGRGGGGGTRDRGGRRPAREQEREGDDRQPRAKREPRIVEVSSGRLYIGNLDYEVTEEELHDLFKGFGNVVSAEIVTNQRTEQSKGFAFVEMGSIEEAKRAVEILHDKDFMGRKITVTGAKSDGPVDPDNPPANDGSSETADSTAAEDHGAGSAGTDSSPNDSDASAAESDSDSTANSETQRSSD